MLQGPCVTNHDASESHCLPEERIGGYSHRIWAYSYRYCGRDYPGNYRPWQSRQNDVHDPLDGPQIGRLSWRPLAFQSKCPHRLLAESCRAAAAFGGKADIADRSHHVR
jgi:hypothetical protein